MEHQKSIILSTYGVLYFGTPHQGGEGVPLAQIMIRILSLASFTNPKLLSQIGKHSEWVQDLQSRYNAVCENIAAVFFYETEPMPILKFGRLLVRSILWLFSLPTNYF